MPTCSERKISANPRKTDYLDLKAVGDPLQIVHFRKCVALTTAPLQIPSKAKWRVTVPQHLPIQRNRCSPCGMEYLKVDLDETMEWVKCDFCWGRRHLQCSNYMTEGVYICIHWFTANIKSVVQMPNYTGNHDAIREQTTIPFALLTSTERPRRNEEWCKANRDLRWTARKESGNRNWAKTRTWKRLLLGPPPISDCKTDFY